MTIHIETAAVGVVALSTSLVGGAINTLADVAADPFPTWVQPFMGPAGTVVCFVIAIRWLTGRLDRNEQKFDAMDAKRDADREAMIKLMAHTAEAISDMTRTVAGCPGNNPPKTKIE